MKMSPGRIDFVRTLPHLPPIYDAMTVNKEPMMFREPSNPRYPCSPEINGGDGFGFGHGLLGEWHGRMSFANLQ